MYLEDPWTLPSPSTSDEDPRITNMEMSLSTMDISHQFIIYLDVDPSPSSSRTEEEDLFALPTWEFASS